MITLIGSRCTASNRFSQGVLIRQSFLLGNMEISGRFPFLFDMRFVCQTKTGNDRDSLVLYYFYFL